MATVKKKLQFSRKLLAIPYALFLAFFVVIPLLIILYYAFVKPAKKLKEALEDLLLEK